MRHVCIGLMAGLIILLVYAAGTVFFDTFLELPTHNILDSSENPCRQVTYLPESHYRYSTGTDGSQTLGYDEQ